MSEEGFQSVKTRILKIFQDLDEGELSEIKDWICNQSYQKDLENMRKLNETDNKLVKIGKAIKKIVPLSAELPDENIAPPTAGDQSDCTVANTCHVDGFLYDDDETEQLVKKGLLKRYYCLDCHSRNIKDLIFISHSMSRITMQYTFKVLLPRDLDEKQILDVGSRFGNILYGAYYLTNASHIIGVEINQKFCDIQKQIMSKFSIDSNRVKMINSDIMECQDIISNSDIIILNALDFFVDTEQHRQIWKFCKKSFKKGSYLVTTRCVTELLESLNICEELSDWLTICKPCQLENEILFDTDDLVDIELFLYIVK
ncbi:uncharacterized protein LOC105387971 [Plutella xylostella]|uniref:uncharacterized protein LOC105387971 n=1 Tax=Plutella xylostella TaxID=51655 RepID=UPI002032E842|nr:uncharacterized protein LOC105387971 [Plutella xylostella]